MSLDFLLGTGAGVSRVHDIYNVSDKTVVEFWCPGKHKRIRAPLSGDFSLAVQSHWQGLVSGIADSSLLEAANGIMMAIGGQNIVQPWFGRQYWQKTDPFKFSLPLHFQSRMDAYGEVFLPAMGLLSLLFPRVADTTDAKKDTADVLSRYFVPGPPLTFSADKPDGIGIGTGDRVEIRLGSFLRFKGAYLRSVTLNVTNSFSLEGYPHNVKADVQFEAMDASFVNADGSFMEGGLGEQRYELNDGLQTCLDFVKKWAAKLESGVNTIKNKLLE